MSNFADETKAALGISSEEDNQALQKVLKYTYKWSKDNNMEFNSTKFECDMDLIMS